MPSKGPHNWPAREPGADYRGPFTVPLSITHRMGIPVRQFGEKLLIFHVMMTTSRNEDKCYGIVKKYQVCIIFPSSQ
jgi:hypothetical protein